MSPSLFIVEWTRRRSAELNELRRGTSWRALDVAMGRGRHVVPLARAGFRVFGVDLKLDAIRDAVTAAESAGFRVHAWCADLTQHPLPLARFDLIVVSRYLQRDLFEPLQASVVPGGVVLYETFTTAQRALGTGPTSPDHLLEPGELRARFDIDGWDVLFYEETLQPEAMARLAAQRRWSA
jgi:tellurite methyltransferase